MKWEVRQVPVSNLRRQSRSPMLGFVEKAIDGGIGYSFGEYGYFIVAEETSLLPKFVVELRLPYLPTRKAYHALAEEMIERSGGMLFFDTSNTDAYAFAWQLQLPVVLGSPLFQYSPKVRKYSSGTQNVKLATKGESTFVQELLTSIPKHYGGVSTDEVKRRLELKQVYLLEVDKKPVGAALVETQGQKYAWLDTFVLTDTMRRRGLGHKLFERLGLVLGKQGRHMIFGLSHQGGNEYGGVTTLGSKIIKQSGHAYLRGITPKFKLER
jgi:N-acetylglutamate synthase-like GNAT family acetyltransferase